MLVEECKHENQQKYSSLILPKSGNSVQVGTSSADLGSLDDAYLTELYLQRYGVSESTPPLLSPAETYKLKENELSFSGILKCRTALSVDGNIARPALQSWCPRHKYDHSNNRILSDIESNVHLRQFLDYADKQGNYGISREASRLDVKLKNARCQQIRDELDNSYRYTSPRAGRPCVRSPLHLWRFATQDKYKTIHPLHCKNRESIDNKPLPSRALERNTTLNFYSNSKACDYQSPLPIRPKSCDFRGRQNYADDFLGNSTLRNYRPGVVHTNRQVKNELRLSVDRVQKRPFSATARFAGDAFVDSSLDQINIQGPGSEMVSKLQTNLHPQTSFNILERPSSVPKSSKRRNSQKAVASNVLRLNCKAKSFEKSIKNDKADKEIWNSPCKVPVKTERHPVNEKRKYTHSGDLDLSSKKKAVRKKLPLNLHSKSNKPKQMPTSYVHTCEDSRSARDSQSGDRFRHSNSLFSFKPLNRKEIAASMVKQTNKLTNESYNAYAGLLYVSDTLSNLQRKEEASTKTQAERDFGSLESTSYGWNFQKFMSSRSLRYACRWRRDRYLQPQFDSIDKMGTSISCSDGDDSNGPTYTSKNQPSYTERSIEVSTENDYIGGSNYEIRTWDGDKSKVSRFKVTSKDRPSLDWKWNKTEKNADEKFNMTERVDDYGLTNKSAGNNKMWEFIKSKQKDDNLFKEIKVLKISQKVGIEASKDIDEKSPKRDLVEQAYDYNKQQGVLLRARGFAQSRVWIKELQTQRTATNVCSAPSFLFVPDWERRNPCFSRQATFIRSKSSNSHSACLQDHVSTMCRSVTCEEESIKQKTKNRKAPALDLNGPCSFLALRDDDTQPSTHPEITNPTQSMTEDKDHSKEHKPDLEDRQAENTPDSVGKKTPAVNHVKSTKERKSSKANKYFTDGASSLRSLSNKSFGSHRAKTRSSRKLVKKNLNKFDRNNKESLKLKDTHTSTLSGGIFPRGETKGEPDDLNFALTKEKTALRQDCVAPGTKSNGDPGMCNTTLGKTVRACLNENLLGTPPTCVRKSFGQSEASGRSDESAFEYSKNSCLLTFSSGRETRPQGGSSVDCARYKPLKIVASLSPSASFTGRTLEGSDLDEFSSVKVRHVTLTNLDSAGSGLHPDGTDLDSFFGRRLKNVTVITPSSAITGPTAGGSSVDELEGREASHVAVIKSGENRASEGSGADGFSCERPGGALGNPESSATVESYRKSVVDNDEGASGQNKIISGFFMGFRKLVANIGELANEAAGDREDSESEELKSRSRESSVDPINDVKTQPITPVSSRVSRAPTHHSLAQIQVTEAAASHKQQKTAGNSSGPSSLDSTITTPISRTTQSDLFIPIKALLKKLAKRKGASSSLSMQKKLKPIKTKQVGKKKDKETKELKIVMPDRSKTLEKGQAQSEINFGQFQTAETERKSQIDKKKMEALAAVSAHRYTIKEDTRTAEARKTLTKQDEQPQVNRKREPREKAMKRLTKATIPKLTESQMTSEKPKQTIYSCPATMRIQLKESKKKEYSRSDNALARMEANRQRQLALVYSENVYRGRLVESVLAQLKKQAMRSALKQEKMVSYTS